MAVAAICLLHLFAILIFLRGFFPPRPERIPTDEHNNNNNNNNNNDSASEFNSPIVGKTVVLVIDALRPDFLFDWPAGRADERGAHMPYLRDLTTKGQRSIKFVAKVNSPTVTLPRIKALTSGTIPGFMDVVTNFGASEFLDDNFVEQAFRRGDRLVFYGDDTWMRLFPRQFHRSEGTTSFYVNDFQEVDDNVTRHLTSEMRLDDWNILVLHYLGLDHIGHVHGPHSDLIGRKLREMDNVIQLLDVALLAKESAAGADAKPSLLIICGDHGMNEAGGHGGSSHSETHVPLVFVSTAFKEFGNVHDWMEARQIDFAPTLSALHGLPIPKNSLGLILPRVFDKLNWKRRLHYSRANADQLRQLMSPIKPSCLRTFDIAEVKHSDWLHSVNTSIGDQNPIEIEANYRNAAICLSHWISSHLDEYEDYTLLVAILLHWLTPFYIVILAAATTNQNRRFSSRFISRKFALISGTIFIFHYLFCKISEQCFLCSFSKASVASVVLATFFVSRAIVGPGLTVSADFGDSFSSESALLCFGCILHAISFASTSFIEEEHQTWYFLCATYFILSAVSSKSTNDFLRTVAAAAIFRTARSWNATGDKWAHLNDIGDTLNRPDNKIWLTCVVVAGFLVIVLLRLKCHRRPITVLLAVTFLVTYLFHAANGTLLGLPFVILNSRFIGIWLARLNYVMAFFVASLAFVTSQNTSERFESVATGWIATSALLFRPHNIPLLALWLSTNKLLCSRLRHAKRSPFNVSVVYVWLAQASFFQQGNSNSLVRIELASGYVGLTGYSAPLVGMLLIGSTYAGPVLWLLSLFATVHKGNDEKRFSTNCHLTLLACRTLPWSVYSLVVYTQRYHLFVWTVFSPKLLFEGMLSLVYVAFTLLALITVGSG